ncbi:MAG: bifunctional ornithine acetyltransferase/N-acetylglutamate synthase [Clostridia bacterium]|nr:bifunctional ornithine acetyltransferase/N-acetylglutamate synthase [Clostridia bacterium]
MNFIEKGVCAPKGFKAGGIHCGIRKNKIKKDIALIVSDVPASAAAVYTTNLVKGAPLVVTKKHLENGVAKAVICNSGNANTCNADGVEVAEKMCQLVADEIGINADDVVVASTGVIGQPLDITPIKDNMKALCQSISYENGLDAAEAIMTTDTKVKEVAVEFEIDGKICKMGGIGKGSGMIHPNMATMLIFITTDVNISKELLDEALKEDIKDSFNMISVDGDTSTNDMVTILANGMAENAVIDKKDENFEIFKKALNKITVSISRMIAGDGEGATKLLECRVINAKSKEIAKMVSKSVICSSLVKAAMFGSDANWGRVLCAIGYSGADVDVEKVDVSFESAKGVIEVCKDGAGVEFSEEKAKEILLENEIIINIDLNDGKGEATAWGCDLTYDYVKINGDYRT